jgi:hypothetical protein
MTLNDLWSSYKLKVTNVKIALASHAIDSAAEGGHHSNSWASFYLLGSRLTDRSSIIDIRKLAKIEFSKLVFTVGSNNNMVAFSIVAIIPTVTDCSSERNEIRPKLQRLPHCSATIDAFDHINIGKFKITSVKPDIETTLERQPIATRFQRLHTHFGPLL